MNRISFLPFLIISCITLDAFVIPSAQTAVGVKMYFPVLKGPPLYMSSDNDMPTSAEAGKRLPMLLDPGTKGGALFLSLILFIIPLVGYQIVTNIFGVDGIEAGKWIGVGFTAFTTVLWVSTYIFRVATKDMTYARQLKDYENAVIAKRLEELDDDEIQALVEDIERDEF